MTKNHLMARSEVPVELTWDLTLLYPSDDAMRADLDATLTLADKLSGFAGHLNGAKELLAASVRELSKEITVNPNTVQKAYRELERQGYVYTTSGVGTFVADIGGVRPDTKELELAKANLDDDFRQLLYLGLSFEEARQVALGIIDERRPAND